jgi:hypothetical protein
MSVRTSRLSVGVTVEFRSSGPLGITARSVCMPGCGLCNALLLQRKAKMGAETVGKIGLQSGRGSTFAGPGGEIGRVGERRQGAGPRPAGETPTLPVTNVSTTRFLKDRGLLPDKRLKRPENAAGRRIHFRKRDRNTLQSRQTNDYGLGLGASGAGLGASGAGAGGVAGFSGSGAGAGGGVTGGAAGVGVAGVGATAGGVTGVTGVGVAFAGSAGFVGSTGAGAGAGVTGTGAGFSTGGVPGSGVTGIAGVPGTGAGAGVPGTTAPGVTAGGVPPGGVTAGGVPPGVGLGGVTPGAPSTGTTPAGVSAFFRSSSRALALSSSTFFASALIFSSFF